MLEKEHEMSILESILHQLKTPLMIILILSSIISMSLGEYVNGTAILVTIILNAYIAIYMERDANSALDALSKMTESMCNVRRNNNNISLHSEQLVPGDLITLKTGDLVPADILLLNSHEITVDEALLTGESTEVHKSTWIKNISQVSNELERKAVDEKKEEIVEKKLLMPIDRVYMGTHITGGNSEGVVIATGMRAKVGEVATMLHEAGGGNKVGFTSLQKSLESLGGLLGVLAFLVCGLVFMAGMLHGNKDPAFGGRNLWLQMTMVAVSLAVSGIPEGLPLVVTICLAKGTARLSKIKALVRSLPAVENLGTTRVICTDKTGTLTEGKMTIVKMWGLSSVENGSIQKSRVTPYKLDYKQHANDVRVEGQPSIQSSAEIGLGLGSGSGIGVVTGVVIGEEEHRYPPYSDTFVDNSSKSNSNKSRSRDSHLNGSYINRVPNYISSWKLTGATRFEYLINNNNNNNNNNNKDNKDNKDNKTKKTTNKTIVKKTTDGVATLSIQMSLLVGALCNNAQWIDGKAIGNSSDTALLAAAADEPELTQIREEYPRILEIPFSSARKLMVTIHRSKTTGQYLLCIKGAPNYLLPHCEQVLLSEGTTIDLSDIGTAAVQHAVDRQARNALRVLSLAYSINLPCWLLARLNKETPQKEKKENKENKEEEKKQEEEEEEEEGEGEDDDEEDDGTEEVLLRRILKLPLVFCGLAGLQDPERKGVRSAIQQAREADIRVVMITGDYLETAGAIARNIQLIPLGASGSKRCLDCSTLRPENLGGEYLPDRELDELTCHTSVFARATPADKLQIVSSLQRQGLICAMTGDGVNDAPALKQADIGIAMGSGTAVAQGASKLILQDDDFSTIVEAIKEGRSIYDNILKFVIYLLGTIFTQLTCILVCVAAGIISPLTPIQVLYVNLITDGVSSISLSYEKTEEDVMKLPPRDTKAPLLNNQRISMVIIHALTLSICALTSLLLGLHWHVGVFTLADISELCINSSTSDQCDYGIHVARTMVFLTIAFSEGARVYTVRRFREHILSNIFSNSALLILTVITTVITLLCWLTPGLRDIFDLVPLNDWRSILVPFGGVFFTILADELYKFRMRYIARKEQLAALDANRWRNINAALEAITFELKQLRTHYSIPYSLQ